MVHNDDDNKGITIENNTSNSKHPQPTLFKIQVTRTSGLRKPNRGKKRNPRTIREKRISQENHFEKKTRTLLEFVTINSSDDDNCDE